MKKLKVVDMAWCAIAKREATINALVASNMKIPDDIDDEELLNIVIDRVSDENINYAIWKIAKSNPHIKHCHGCAHLLEKE
jgi:hypothetical protein